MTRKEFVQRYAEKSGLSDEWAALGLIDVGSRTLFALPCGCGDEGCGGWAMLSPGTVLDFLATQTPEKLRRAYNEGVAASGGAE